MNNHDLFSERPSFRSFNDGSSGPRIIPLASERQQVTRSSSSSVVSTSSHTSTTAANKISPRNKLRQLCLLGSLLIPLSNVLYTSTSIAWPQASHVWSDLPSLAAMESDAWPQWPRHNNKNNINPLSSSFLTTTTRRNNSKLLWNGLTWFDTNRNPIHAHGGGMIVVNETYYLLGEHRTPKKNLFKAVSLYKSVNLHDWEFVHDILTRSSHPDLQVCNLERPKIIYNEATKTFVMWMHWENGKNYYEARVGVATSDKIGGDYVWQSSFRPLQDDPTIQQNGIPGYMSRDLTVFVDTADKEKTAYLISSANNNADLHLYQLTPDYQKVQHLVSKLFVGEKRESPCLFLRRGVYFLLTSGCTYWMPNQAMYATTSNLQSGNWSHMQTVADDVTFYSQPTYVLPIATADDQDDTKFLYLGDRWAGAWRRKVQESIYVWLPLEFPCPTCLEMKWYNSIQMDATTGHMATFEGPIALVHARSGQFMVAHDQQNITKLATHEVQSMPSTSNHENMSVMTWILDYGGKGWFLLRNTMNDLLLEGTEGEDGMTLTRVRLAVQQQHDIARQAWWIQPARDVPGSFRLQNYKSRSYLGIALQDNATLVLQTPKPPQQAQLWYFRY